MRIDLWGLTMQVTLQGRTHILQLLPAEQIKYTQIKDGEETSQQMHISALHKSPIDVVRWLSIGFQGLPARYKERANIKVAKVKG